MIYKNSIKIKNDDLIIDILKVYKEYGENSGELYITGSAADRLTFEEINIDPLLIYRDKFQDIDYIYFGKNQEFLYELRKNKKYDCLNPLFNKIYKIDSSLAEIFYDIKNKVSYFSDGYLKTMQTGELFPPVWCESDFEDIFQGTIDCPDKPFARCMRREATLSTEIINHMNNLMEYIYDIDKEWIISLAILNPNYSIYSNFNWSNKWKEYFDINSSKYSEYDLKSARKYINNNKNRMYFK